MLTGNEPTVFVVDDDKADRWLLVSLMKAVNLRVKTYGSSEEFLAAYEPTHPGCLVLDVRMPGMSGLELQEELIKRGSTLPVILLTGYVDVPIVKRGLKANAIDVIEKPFNDQQLIARIQQAIRIDAESRREQAQLADIAERVAQLTRREGEVMVLVSQGNANKQIAVSLGLSEKTIEVDRARLMKKLRVESLAELVRMVVQTEQRPSISRDQEHGPRL